MKDKMDRRQFIKVIPVAGLGILNPRLVAAQDNLTDLPGYNLKISLNAYSFNEQLRDGSMNLDQLLEFCARYNIDALDATGYYFPGYPEIPPDDYVYKIKRKAFMLGIEISGTGIRNDFTLPDKNERSKEIEKTRRWIEFAARLGAPVIRIFAGKNHPDGYSWDEVTDWLTDDLRECAEYGKEFGVMVAIQNHNDFIKTSDQVLKILDMVNSEWFGLMLDIGSFEINDSYQEIERLASYAISWQIKEMVFQNGEKKATDFKKLAKIIKNSGYRGYLPIETLGPGDPDKKVVSLLSEVNRAIRD